MLTDRTFWLALIAVVGGLAPLAPWATAAGLLLLLVLAVVRFGWRFAAVALTLSLITAVRARATLDDFESRRFDVIEWLDGPRRCAASATVVKSPVVRGGEVSFVAELSDLDCEGRTRSGVVGARLSGGPARLGRGDRFQVVAQLAPVRWFANPGVLDPRPGASRRGALVSGRLLSLSAHEPGGGIAHQIDGFRSRVRARIEATFAPPVVPLARALVLGESDLEPTEGEAFRQSGLMHLLAVSGTHLVFAVLAVVQGLRALLVRFAWLARRYDVERVAVALGAPCSLLYADVSGGSGSAWRAAVMLSVYFGARTLGMRWSGVRCLAASMALLAVPDPLVATDLSFTLSVAATLGLLGLGRRVAALCERRVRGVMRYVASSAVATVSSTLPCAPVLALLDDRQTLAGIPANLLAAPLGELAALPACLLHAVSSSLPALERGLAYLGSGALLGVRWVALQSAAIESASFPVPSPTAWHFVLGALVAWGVALSGRRRRLVVAVVLVGVLGVLGLELVLRRPPDRLQLTFLDVGQGDAALIELPSGAAVLVDGGGFPMGVPDVGEWVVLPVLRARRRSELDLVVLSHAHPDHLLGLVRVFERLRVKELWHPAGAAEPHGNYRRLLELARDQGTKVLGPRELCEGPRDWGGGRWDVLAPCPVREDFDLNDNSLVVRLDFGKRSVLFSGDIEGPAEADLVARKGARLAADVLKVPHHGSDTSSSEAFLELVRPSVAVISSGVRNRFDHPRKSVLERFSRHRVEPLRTDRRGAIVLSTDGQGWWMTSELGPVGRTPSETQAKW